MEFIKNDVWSVHVLHTIIATVASQKILGPHVKINNTENKLQYIKHYICLRQKSATLKNCREL